VKNSDGFDETAHFEARLRQRGVRKEVVDAILEYGSSHRVRGAESYCMDKRARAKARKALGKKAYARLESRMNIYIIASDRGSLLTVAHRLRHHRKSG